jgi:hypothetical protein
MRPRIRELPGLVEKVPQRRFAGGARHAESLGGGADGTLGAPTGPWGRRRLDRSKYLLQDPRRDRQWGPEPMLGGSLLDGAKAGGTATTKASFPG